MSAKSFALWPNCWQNFLKQLTNEGCPLRSVFFNDHCWPIVFLHERVSHGGVRRIVCMEMRPNIDHLQLCSLDCVVITPATLWSAPKVWDSLVAWIPGWWWNHGVCKEKLKLAQADPKDASHFVLQYEQKTVQEEVDAGISTEGKSTIFIVDCWLNDNGTVTAKVRDSE